MGKSSAVENTYLQTFPRKATLCLAQNFSTQRPHFMRRHHGIPKAPAHPVTHSCANGSVAAMVEVVIMASAGDALNSLGRYSCMNNTHRQQVANVVSRTLV